MPIAAVHRTPRRRDRFSWYPVFEALWFLIAVIATALLPIADMHPVVFTSILAPGAFVGTVRVIEAIADVEAARKRTAARSAA